MDRAIFFGKLSRLPAADIEKLVVAYWLAKDVHRGQLRAGGERYFEHVRGVALLLIEHGYTQADILIRALLHDLIEDTATPFGIISWYFGESVLDSLKTLSKKVPVFDPKNGKVIMRLIIEDHVYYANLMKAPVTDRLVKCADRLHNLRSMSPWQKEKQIAYARHTQQFVLPLARITDNTLAEEIEHEVTLTLASV